jgi:hypothetical protein
MDRRFRAWSDRTGARPCPARCQSGNEFPHSKAPAVSRSGVARPNHLFRLWDRNGLNQDTTGERETALATEPNSRLVRAFSLAIGSRYRPEPVGAFGTAHSSPTASLQVSREA